MAHTPTYSATEAAQRMVAHEQRMRSLGEFDLVSWRGIDFGIPRLPTTSPTKQLEKLKRSVQQIEVEPFSDEAKEKVEQKIQRLEAAGATAQAEVLYHELITREKLARLKRWDFDYKLLTKKTINSFEQSNTMSLTRDGLCLHIDRIEAYVGNPESGKEKDRLIPDNILTELEKAKDRNLFDAVAILWAEKVPDPLLLGIIDGCEDYFYIAEWGEDVSFEQLTKDLPGKP